MSASNLFVGRVSKALQELTEMVDDERRTAAEASIVNLISESPFFLAQVLISIASDTHQTEVQTSHVVKQIAAILCKQFHKKYTLDSNQRIVILNSLLEGIFSKVEQEESKIRSQLIIAYSYVFREWSVESITTLSKLFEMWSVSVAAVMSGQATNRHIVLAEITHSILEELSSSRLPDQIHILVLVSTTVSVYLKDCWWKVISAYWEVNPEWVNQFTELYSIVVSSICFVSNLPGHDVNECLMGLMNHTFSDFPKVLMLAKDMIELDEAQVIILAGIISILDKLTDLPVYPNPNDVIHMEQELSSFFLEFPLKEIAIEEVEAYYPIHVSCLNFVESIARRNHLKETSIATYFDRIVRIFAPYNEDMIYVWQDSSEEYWFEDLQVDKSQDVRKAALAVLWMLVKQYREITVPLLFDLIINPSLYQSEDSVNLVEVCLYCAGNASSDVFALTNNFNPDEWANNILTSILTSEFPQLRHRAIWLLAEWIELFSTQAQIAVCNVLASLMEAETDAVVQIQMAHTYKEVCDYFFSRNDDEKSGESAFLSTFSTCIMGLVRFLTELKTLEAQQEIVNCLTFIVKRSGEHVHLLSILWDNFDQLWTFKTYSEQTLCVSLINLLTFAVDAMGTNSVRLYQLINKIIQHGLHSGNDNFLLHPTLDLWLHLIQNAPRYIPGLLELYQQFWFSIFTNNQEHCGVLFSIMKSYIILAGTDKDLQNDNKLKIIKDRCDEITTHTLSSIQNVFSTLQNPSLTLSTDQFKFARGLSSVLDAIICISPDAHQCFFDKLLPLCISELHRNINLQVSSVDTKKRHSDGIISVFCLPLISRAISLSPYLMNQDQMALFSHACIEKKDFYPRLPLSEQRYVLLALVKGNDPKNSEWILNEVHKYMKKFEQDIQMKNEEDLSVYQRKCHMVSMQSFVFNPYFCQGIF